ncbi:hypothetical protein JTE90_006122 [Oedothorax gibbosus]|uniref:Uncharacterized protein n=1 Tax=Oedothorax gibbosus TaxID=931172 RepID=A0AAV6V5M8_9ARAC|nr:hypothetical protein JTE90_006122 [Oedothorax gibbosus]
MCKRCIKTSRKQDQNDAPDERGATPEKHRPPSMIVKLISGTWELIRHVEYGMIFHCGKRVTGGPLFMGCCPEEALRRTGEQQH